MESRNDEFGLEATLRALRPTPSPAFAAELDARAAAGFPATTGRSRSTTLSRFTDRLRAVPARRLLAPATACALAGVAVATAVVATSEGGHNPTTVAEVHFSEAPAVGAASSAAGHTSAGTRHATAKSFLGASAASGDSSGVQFSNVLPLTRVVPQSAPANQTGLFAANARHRDVERSAQIVLGTDASGVGDAAAKVFDVVHSYDGIVLNSSIRQGGGGNAGATFDLLIPSARLSDALADFSQIAEVRSRHEATTDVTAPTIGLAERLRDARAEVEGLLGQLAKADTEAERASVEAELRDARAHVAALQARQTTLQRQVHLSRVTLRIESGPSASEGSGGGSWGIGNALHDAGHILAVAAGVALIGLAVVGPIALLCLLAWFAHRAWVRRRREQALD